MTSNELAQCEHCHEPGTLSNMTPVRRTWRSGVLQRPGLYSFLVHKKCVEGFQQSMGQRDALTIMVRTGLRRGFLFRFFRCGFIYDGIRDLNRAEKEPNPELAAFWSAVFFVLPPWMRRLLPPK